MQLVLLIPELFWPAADDTEVLADLDCPALSAVLARGSFSRQMSMPFEDHLARCFGLSQPAPLGALRRLGEETVPASNVHGRWLAADPIHLRYHQERVILADPSQFAIEIDEAQQLVDGLNGFFGELGRFHLASPMRWYLELAAGTPLEGFSPPGLSAVAGRVVDHLLPEILSNRPLRNLFNEIQSLLHTHPINRQRQADGQVPVNGLWLWGGGRLESTPGADFTAIWSRSRLARGLGHAAQIGTHELPPDWRTLVNQSGRDGNHLVVLENLCMPTQYEDQHAYREELHTLEQRWIAPIVAAMADGRVDSLIVQSPCVFGVTTWHYRPRDRWRVWRRPQSLDATARTLAANNARTATLPR